MRYFLLSVLAGIVALGVVIGCGSGSNKDIVAVVNGDKIPMSLIDTYFKKMGYQFESPEQEYKKKKEALDSLIDYKLLVKGGYAAGLASDPDIQKLMTAERPKFLFDAMYKAEVGGAEDVGDQEVDQFYNNMKTEREVAHILVPTEEEADSLYDLIANGADFGEVARINSIDYATAVNGGQIGYISWGANILPELRDTAFALEIGSVSKPFQTANGWHIVKVTGERDHQLMPKKEMYPYIVKTLETRKATEAEHKFIEAMKEKASVEINHEATKMLLEKLDMYYPDTLSGVPRPDNYFPQLDLLEPYEQQMVFASYAGGELTVKDYIDQIENVPDAYRPRFDNYEGLKDLVFQLEMNNIMEYQADQSGIDKTADYQKRVDNFRDGLVAEKFRQDILGNNVDVTDDEVVEYYNQNLGDYTIPAQYHLLEIEQSSLKDAQAIIAKLQNGADFSKLAAQNTTRIGMKSVKGDLGYVTENRYPALYKAAQGLDINQISDVIVNAAKHYSIIKLLEVKPQKVLPLKQVQNAIQQKIIELRRVSAAKDWLAQAREKASIEIRDDVLQNSIKTTKNEKQS